MDTRNFRRGRRACFSNLGDFRKINGQSLQLYSCSCNCCADSSTMRIYIIDNAILYNIIGVHRARLSNENLAKILDSYFFSFFLFFSFGACNFSPYSLRRSIHYIIVIILYTQYFCNTGVCVIIIIYIHSIRDLLPRRPSLSHSLSTVSADTAVPQQHARRLSAAVFPLCPRHAESRSFVSNTLFDLMDIGLVAAPYYHYGKKIKTRDADNIY